MRVWALAGAYFLTARFGLLFAVAGSSATPIWPPAGIAVAAVLLLGPGMWPGILIGSTVAQMVSGTSPPIALVVGIGATAEALLAHRVVQRAGFCPQLDRPVDVAALAAGSVLSSVAGAVIGVGVLGASGQIASSSVGLAALAWWLGDALSIFVIGGLVVTWAADPVRHAFRARPLEAAIDIGGLLVISVVLFFDLLDFQSSGQSVAFPIVPIVIWVAFRLGPRGAALAAFMFTIVAVAATQAGLGPFVGTTRADSLMYLSGFISIVTLTGAGVAAVVAQRDADHAALSESDQRMRAVLRAVPMALYAVDRAGQITFREGSLRNALTDETATASPTSIFASGISPEIAAATRCALDGLAAEAVFERSPRWYGVTSVPTRDQGGGAPGAIGILRDTTEQHLMAIEQSRLARAVEQSADSIVITDAAGSMLYVNPAFERVTGYGRDEVMGKNPRVLQSGVHSPEFYERMWATLTGGQPWSGEFVNRRRDGTLFRERATISPVRDESETVVSYVAVKSDVTDLRAMEEDLALAGRIRDALAAAVQSLPPEATFDEAARAFAGGLCTLPMVDFAAVGAFIGQDDVVVVATNDGHAGVFAPGDLLPVSRARRIRELLGQAPFGNTWRSEPEDGTFGRAVDQVGLRAFAFGPIVHGDHQDGGVVIGTRDAEFARTLVDKADTVLDFSSVSSAVLGERLHAHCRQVELRRSLEETLATRAFHPVFQPIVELATGEIVGYEALTQFDSGQRPDLCFQDAWSAGLGEAFEFATLEHAIAAVRTLPLGRWLDVNVSPRLLAERDRLRSILWQADRPIVLEVTEHEPVEDYGALREAVRSLGRDIRLAVDDAGAGVANFGHIIELGADFVKLDTSLVRRVNGNLGRQALVVGMRHFARASGCRLVAEGIETEDEARTLAQLGVEFGQGYWFAVPAEAPERQSPGTPRPELAAGR